MFLSTDFSGRGSASLMCTETRKYFHQKTAQSKQSAITLETPQMNCIVNPKNESLEEEKTKNTNAEVEVNIEYSEDGEDEENEEEGEEGEDAELYTDGDEACEERDHEAEYYEKQERLYYEQHPPESKDHLVFEFDEDRNQRCLPNPGAQSETKSRVLDPPEAKSETRLKTRSANRAKDESRLNKLFPLNIDETASPFRSFVFASRPQACFAIDPMTMIDTEVLRLFESRAEFVCQQDSPDRFLPALIVLQNVYSEITIGLKTVDRIKLAAIVVSCAEINRIHFSVRHGSAFQVVLRPGRCIRLVANVRSRQNAGALTIHVSRLPSRAYLYAFKAW